jgi:hypothetical protein
MVGWHFRAAGDNISRYVHDDLYVKALALQGNGGAWALLATDLVGVDALATAQIREGITRQVGLPADAILVTATHCHSGPAVCPVASATSPEQRASTVVQADGSLSRAYGGTSSVAPTAYYIGHTDPDWKEWFVEQAIAAAVEAHAALRPVELAVGSAEVQDMASSRRVLLSDGSWADPRRDPVPDAHVVSRTTIDPFVRVMALRESESKAPLAAVLNYGSHPWIFSTPGYSAELAGATADRVAARWNHPGSESPVVLYTSGPQGDVTLIWNIDIERVWKTSPSESLEQSLARREGAFDRELARMGDQLADVVMSVIRGMDGWRDSDSVTARRSQVTLPLKPGYERPSEIKVAPWQEGAPDTVHLTEVQALRVGETAILGLPGEPFTSLGTAIRSQSPIHQLLIAALANEFGAFGYIADREAYGLGGYELTHTPTAPGAGEALVEAAVALLEAGADH